MYYTKIRIKVKEHLPMYLDREILRTTEDFHTVQYARLQYTQIYW